MSDFADELNRVFKYGADSGTLENLLHQLSDPNSPEVQPNSHHRLVTADALQDHGRDAEAALLRSPHPIYLWNKKVHQARGLVGDANRFRRGYLDAAFWSTSGNDRGDSLDDLGLGLSDLDPEAKKDLYEDAMHFYHSHEHLIPAGEEESAGHYFWLTRNGHGVTFNDVPERFGEHTDALQEAAEKAGEYNLSVYPHPEDNAEGASMKIEGYGGRAGWGQPEGLVEDKK